MTKSMLFVLSVSAGLCAAGVLRAEDASTAASPTAAGAVSDTGTASAAPAAVAKDDAPGSLKAGKALLNAGKDADAVAYFNGIGEQVADHGKAKREPYRQLDLATAYLGLGQYQQAEAAATAATTLMPDLEPAWNDLASAQVNAGDRDAAIATYKKAIAQLTTDGADHDRLDANLQALQAAAGGKSAGAQSSDASAPAATTPSAAPASATPASNAAATVGN